MEDDDGDVVVGQLPTTMVKRHIKKRALRNKGLSVSLNEKDLRDFVSGFQKRKKKRRKEAQRQLQEKERSKRIEARKQRKREREFAIHGGASPENLQVSGLLADEAGTDTEGNEVNKTALLSEMKTYEGIDTTIRVTTSEISHEDGDLEQMRPTPNFNGIPEKNHSLLVKKKPLKRVVTKQKQRKKAKKPASHKDKRKGRGKR